MAYRIYVLGATGRIIIRLHVNCSNDNAAITEARKYANRCDVELWRQGRRIVTVKQDGSCQKSA
jgi:hypothetical protein